MLLQGENVRCFYHSLCNYFVDRKHVLCHEVGNFTPLFMRVFRYTKCWLYSMPSGNKHRKADDYERRYFGIRASTKR